LIGIHRENEGRLDQELPEKELAKLQEQHVSWKEAKLMAGENL
jgi:hypothetical protein